MLLSQSKKPHFLWGLPTLVITVWLVGWYVTESRSVGFWLSGGSLPGLVCGLVAGLIIFFEMLLGPKKWLRRIKWLGAAKFWMAAHLWLGLACLPLAIAHCGMTLGGWLPATLMVLLALTVVSGIYGWVVQTILPRWMLRHLPAETIYGQIDHVSKVTVEDARRMLVAVCGPKKTENFLFEHEPDLVTSDQVVVVGAQRQTGRTQGRTAESRRVRQSLEDSERLWNAFDEIQPFLERGAREKTPVSDPSRSAGWFDRLRDACSEASHESIATLEQMCEQRRQFDVQRTVHWILHGWLPIHIGLSVAVAGLLIAHIWTAIKYW